MNVSTCATLNTKVHSDKVYPSLRCLYGGFSQQQLCLVTQRSSPTALRDETKTAAEEGEYTELDVSCIIWLQEAVWNTRGNSTEWPVPESRIVRRA